MRTIITLDGKKISKKAACDAAGRSDLTVLPQAASVAEDAVRASANMITNPQTVKVLLLVGQ